MLSESAVSCLLRVRSVSFTSRVKGCITFVPHSCLVPLSHKVGVFLEEAICYFIDAKFAVMLRLSIDTVVSNHVNTVVSNHVNTVVSNHFHSVKTLLYSSAISRDFDGTPGTELPVSMYTTKTPIDMCRFNVRSSILKNLNIFCKRQISIKLFYLYQRLQCRDKYFFKIQFVFFLYLRICLYVYISDIRQWGTEHQYLFSCFPADLFRRQDRKKTERSRN